MIHRSSIIKWVSFQCACPLFFSFINLSHIKFNNSSFTLNIAQNDSELSLLPSQFLCTILLVNGKSLLINELSDNFSEMADAIYDTMLSTHPYKARLLKKKCVEADFLRTYFQNDYMQHDVFRYYSKAWIMWAHNPSNIMCLTCSILLDMFIFQWVVCHK